MSTREILIVGPEQNRTGGVSRYMAEQRRHLTGVSTSVYETGPPGARGKRALLVGVLLSLVRMALFPFRRRPDVLHVHSSFQRSFYRNAFYVLFARYVWRRPVVFHIHGSSFDTFLREDSSLEARFQSLVLGAASRVVVLSPYWQSVLADHVPEERIVVVPNAVPTDEYDPVTDRETPHVVFLSNMIDRKGVSEFAAAVDALADRPDAPTFEVTVAGSGPLRDRMESLAAAHDNVTYLGYVEEPDKRALLESATVYALPTKAEGLPIAILEAMAAGTAVVSTPVGSIPEVIDEANGRLVPAGDAEALTDALAGLLADHAEVERMGRTNRETAVADYSWAGNAARLEELYASLDRTVSVRPSPVRSEST